MVRRQSSLVELKLNGATTTVNPVVNVRSLPERHEPDGGEDGVVVGGIGHSLEKLENDDHWSDWEAGDDGEEQEENREDRVFDPIRLDGDLPSAEKKAEQSSASPVKFIKKPIFESDLSALEIQVKSREDEIDFFADMEPTITSAPAVFVPVPVQTKAANGEDRGLNFNVQSQEEKDEDDGWNWDD